MPTPRRSLLAVAVAALIWLTACSPGPRVPVAEPSPSRPASPSAPSVTPTVPAGPMPLAGTNPKAVMTLNGIMAAVTGPAPDGVIVTTPCGRPAVIGHGTPINEATVVLDPGHGGREPGSVGANGLTEKALNLAVSQFTKQALEAKGISVVLTRPLDYRVTLAVRAEIAKALNPRAFVSIHHNGDPDGPSTKPGTETFYQSYGASASESKRLAGLIYEEIVATFSRFPDVAWTADTDAGAKYRIGSAGKDYYGILRHTEGIPAVISEAAFVSNPPEAELLSRPDVQKAEGEAIARAVIRFITTSDPGSGFTEAYPRQATKSGGGSSNCTDPAL